MPVPASRTNPPEKTYSIHIPAFISERNEVEGGMFDFTYDDMIQLAKSKINDHNQLSGSIVTGIRNKTKKRIIDNVNISEFKSGKIPYLLLQISAYNSNFEGQLVKKKSIMPIEQSDKIGSTNNYVLLYPQLSVNDDVKYYNWIVLIYDDPNKNSDDNISNAKTLMRSILKTPIRNIKLKRFINDLKKTEQKPFISLTLTAINYDADMISDELLVYQISSKSTSKVEFEFLNMPFQDIEALIFNKFENKFRNKVLKFRIGRREYKINQDLNDFKEDYESTVEQHFNFSTSVKESNMKSIYEEEFIVNLMEQALHEYLTNSEDELQ